MEKHSAQLNVETTKVAFPLRRITSRPFCLPELKDGLGKKQIAHLADTAVSSLLEEGAVFSVAEALATMEEFVKTVRKDERYIQFLRDELAKHGGRLTMLSGAKLELCEAGVTYDYSANAEWLALEAQRFEIERRKKAVEDKLRIIAPGRVSVDPETGEVLEGAQKTSKSTYRITLAR